MAKSTKQQTRIVSDGLRRKAVEYKTAETIDREEVSALLELAAHLIDAMFSEHDATAARRSLQAAMNGRGRHEETKADREMARRLYDRWQDPTDKLAFRTNTEFGHHVVKHAKKLRSVEHWAKQAGRWRRGL